MTDNEDHREVPDSSAPSLKQWRRARRRELLDKRLQTDPDQRHVWNEAIESALIPLLPEVTGIVYGLYWPYKAEFGVRPLMHRLHDRGDFPALPHVVQPRQPLEFLRWYPTVEMERGVYDIPVPKGTEAVIPDILIIPVVGFDAEGYRLGYGGGYYDRTIAALPRRPKLIGVGYELSRMETIHPHQYDIPLDCVVTEAGVQDSRS